MTRAPPRTEEALTEAANAAAKIGVTTTRAAKINHLADRQVLVGITTALNTVLTDLQKMVTMAKNGAATVESTDPVITIEAVVATKIKMVVTIIEL